MSTVTNGARPPRVLVVDDEENIRYLLVTALRHAEMDVVEAATGREALDSVRSLVEPFRPAGINGTVNLIMLLVLCVPTAWSYAVVMRRRHSARLP